MVYISLLDWTAAVVLAVVYWKSSFSKVLNPYGFREVLRQYGAVPAGALTPLSTGLATMEVLTAVWLVLPVTRLLGAFVGAILQVVFLVMIVRRIGSYFPRGCGCFELNTPQHITWKHALVNAGLLATLLLVGALQWVQR